MAEKTADHVNPRARDFHNKALTASWEEIQGAVSYCLLKASEKFGRSKKNGEQPPEDSLKTQGQ